MNINRCVASVVGACGTAAGAGIMPLLASAAQTASTTLANVPAEGASEAITASLRQMTQQGFKVAETFEVTLSNARSQLAAKERGMG